MRCKICEMPIIGSSPETGAFVMVPTCKCGKMRNKARKQGCYECDATGLDISLEYVKRNGNEYHFKCNACGHTYMWVMDE